MPVGTSLLSILGSAGSAAAGGPQSYWLMRWGGTQTNAAPNAVAGAPNGNIGMVFRQFSFGAGNGTVAVFDADGALLWDKDFDALTVTDITFDSANNVIVFIYNSTTSRVVKIAADGSSVLWTKTITPNTSVTNFGYVAVDPNNDSVIAQVGVRDGSSRNIALYKWNSTGVEQWKKVYGSTGFTSDYQRPLVDASGNVFGAGTISENEGPETAVILKYNTTGAYQNGRQQQANPIDSVQFYEKAAISSNGTIALLGIYNLNGGTFIEEPMIVTFNNSLVRQNFIDPRNGGAFFSRDGIAIDSSDDVYLLGRLGSTSVIAKYNSSLVKQWELAVSSGSGVTLTALALDAAENLVIGFDDQNVPTDSILLKLPNDGSITGTFDGITISTSNTLIQQSISLNDANYSFNQGNYFASGSGSTTLSDITASTTLTPIV